MAVAIAVDELRHEYRTAAGALIVLDGLSLRVVAGGQHAARIRLRVVEKQRHGLERVPRSQANGSHRNRIFIAGNSQSISNGQFRGFIVCGIADLARNT